jgi:hypothetical protein
MERISRELIAQGASPATVLAAQKAFTPGFVTLNSISTSLIPSLNAVDNIGVETLQAMIEAVANNMITIQNLGSFYRAVETSKPKK